MALRVVSLLFVTGLLFGAAAFFLKPLYWPKVEIPTDYGLTQVVDEKNKIRCENDEMRTAFKQAKIKMPPKLEAAMKKIEQVLERLGKALEKEDGTTLAELRHRFDCIYSDYSRQRQEIVRILSQMRSVTDASGSKYHQKYLELCMESIGKKSEFLLQVVDGQSEQRQVSEEQRIFEERRNALARILNLLQIQHELAQDTGTGRYFPRITRQNPLAGEFLDFSRELMKSYEQDFEGVMNGGSISGHDYLTYARSCWDEILRKESERLQMGEHFKNLKGSDDFNAYDAAIKKMQQVYKKRFELFMNRKKMDQAGLQPLNDELEHCENELEAARKVLDVSTGLQRDLDKINEFIKKCPELSTLELLPRFEEIAREFKAQSILLLKQPRSERNVAGIESEMNLERLRRRIERLIEDARFESELISRVKGREKLDSDSQKSLDMAISGAREQYRELQELDEMKIDIRTRIKLLEYKSGLVDKQRDEIRGSSSALLRNLEQTMSRLASKSAIARQMKEAGRIPLVAPIDNAPVR